MDSTDAVYRVIASRSSPNSIRVMRSMSGAPAVRAGRERAHSDSLQPGGEDVFSAQRASQDTGTVHTVQLGPFELAGKEPLKLQIFIDASVIEAFANGRACLTERANPARKE